MARGLKVKLKRKSQAEMKEIHRQTGCVSKKAYFSEGDALFGVRNAGKRGVILQSYKCVFCPWWHNRTKPRYD